MLYTKAQKQVLFCKWSDNGSLDHQLVNLPLVGLLTQALPLKPWCTIIKAQQLDLFDSPLLAEVRRLNYRPDSDLYPIHLPFMYQFGYGNESIKAFTAIKAKFASLRAVLMCASTLDSQFFLTCADFQRGHCVSTARPFHKETALLQWSSAKLIATSDCPVVCSSCLFFSSLRCLCRLTSSTLIAEPYPESQFLWAFLESHRQMLRRIEFVWRKATWEIAKTAGSISPATKESISG